MRGKVVPRWRIFVPVGLIHVPIGGVFVKQLGGVSRWAALFGGRGGLEEGDLQAVGVLEAGVEVAPGGADGFVDEGGAVGEQALKGGGEVGDLQGEADGAADALADFKLVYDLGLAFIEEFEGGAAEFEQHGLAAVVLPDGGGFEAEAGAVEVYEALVVGGGEGEAQFKDGGGGHGGGLSGRGIIYFTHVRDKDRDNAPPTPTPLSAGCPRGVLWLSCGVLAGRGYDKTYDIVTPLLFILSYGVTCCILWAAEGNGGGG